MMKHLPLLLYMVSLFSGVAAVSASLLFAHIRRSKDAANAGLLIVSIFMSVLGDTLCEYAAINDIFTLQWFSTACAVLSSAGCLLSAAVLPRLAAGCFKNVRGNPLPTAVYFAELLCAACGMVLFLRQNDALAESIFRAAFAVSYVWSAGIGIMHFRKTRTVFFGGRIGGPRSALVALVLILPYVLPLYSVSIFFTASYFLFTNGLCILLLFRSYGFAPHNAGMRGFGGNFGLTQRELEIAGRAIAGDSNRAIGLRLFISTKTVETHITNIYHKTGVKNRIQLRMLLEGSDLLRGDPAVDPQFRVNPD